MKFKFIKSTDKEEVVVYSKEKNDLVSAIESLILQYDNALIGYKDDEFKELNILEIDCFFTQNDKVYARVNNENFIIRKRLYELYEFYKDSFMYINQGCLANIKRIERFRVSIGGSLLVVFNSGYEDYVSRRQLKSVKERIGVK